MANCESTYTDDGTPCEMPAGWRSDHEQWCKYHVEDELADSGEDGYGNIPYGSGVISDENDLQHLSYSIVNEIFGGLEPNQEIVAIHGKPYLHADVGEGEDRVREWLPLFDAEADSGGENN